MSKFIYRMQSILEIKVKLEEQAKMNFAAARIRLDEEEEKLLQLENRKAAYEEQGRNLQKDSIHVQDIIENRGAITRIKEFITHQQIVVDHAIKEVDVATQQLQLAMQESKTHEKLKEKALEEFRYEENVREAKEVDELIGYKYSKNAQNV